jgi:hypothetical protein
MLLWDLLSRRVVSGVPLGRGPLGEGCEHHRLFNDPCASNISAQPCARPLRPWPRGSTDIYLLGPVSLLMAGKRLV